MVDRPRHPETFLSQCVQEASHFLLGKQVAKEKRKPLYSKRKLCFCNFLIWKRLSSLTLQIQIWRTGLIPLRVGLGDIMTYIPLSVVNASKQTNEEWFKKTKQTTTTKRNRYLDFPVKGRRKQTALIFSPLKLISTTRRYSSF